MTTAGTLDFDSCYRALQARDARFDGQFFVTVTTTGIYCRPSCPAQTPLARNVSFVVTAAAAQRAGYRACRRCVPDAVPGSPRWNSSADLAARAMRLISDGVVDRVGVDGLAAALGYSVRQLNRVLSTELGAGPLALARAQRATNARVLVQCTTMPMSQIAFAAGFSSIRQFNDTMREVFALSPTKLRALRASRPQGATGIVLRLPYRPPLNTAWLRWFLAAHEIPGVAAHREAVPGDPATTEYVRTIMLPHGPAEVAIGLPESSDDRGFVLLRCEHLDMRDLGVAVNRVRRLLDLDADAAAAESALSRDRRLAPLIAAATGLRSPGTLDPVETLITTMIGQQISVKAACTHVGALVAELGDDVPWPVADGPAKLFPTPAAIAELGADVLRGPRRRIAAITAAAARIAEGSMELHGGLTASNMRALLLSLSGVGGWTADYVTMRACGDPDILLAGDLVVARAADDLGIDLADTSDWSPWRSYASMHLWRHRILPCPTPA